MKFSTTTAALAVCLISILLVNSASLLPSTQIARRVSPKLNSSNLYACLLAERDLNAAELYKRGVFSNIGSKISGLKNKVFGPKKDIKVTYDVRNNKPETPVGEFRPLTAGKHNDYFGNWQTMTNGVDNPAAGQGRGKRDILEWSNALEECNEPNLAGEY
ncbi:hypothetical protein C0991_001444 [Blastosporella zonata]|nr:hypothetical protein C0991_001444 [Blastosporella zonata]